MTSNQAQGCFKHVVIIDYYHIQDLQDDPFQMTRPNGDREVEADFSPALGHLRKPANVPLRNLDACNLHTKSKISYTPYKS